MKKTILINLLIIHGLGINVLGFIIGLIYFHPVNKGIWFLIWIASLQLNSYCIYHYKKRYPNMVDPDKNEQKSPWLNDLFKIR